MKREIGSLPPMSSEIYSQRVRYRALNSLQQLVRHTSSLLRNAASLHDSAASVAAHAPLQSLLQTAIVAQGTALRAAADVQAVLSEAERLETLLELEQADQDARESDTASEATHGG